MSARPSGAAAPGSAWAAPALVFNALTFGLSWWPFRQVAGWGVHPLWLTATSFAGVVALLLLARPAALAELLHSRRLWALMAAAGATNACFNWAMSVGDVVRVVLLFYLMPLWTVLLARVLLGERISARGALRVALALGGALVVLWPDGAAVAGPRHPGAAAGPGPVDGPSLIGGLGLADALGLAGGLGFALNNVLLRRSEGRNSPAASSLAMFAGGALVAAVLALVLSQAGRIPAWPGWQGPWPLAAAGMGLWFLVANLALQYGVARLPANTVSVILITEVFFASASALALGAGVLGPREALGGAMILGAALLAALQRG